MHSNSFLPISTSMCRALSRYHGVEEIRIRINKNPSFFYQEHRSYCEAMPETFGSLDIPHSSKVHIMPLLVKWHGVSKTYWQKMGISVQTLPFPGNVILNSSIWTTLHSAQHKADTQYIFVKGRKAGKQPPMDWVHLSL